MEQQERADVIKRLKTIRGHLQGVEKMIDEGKNCDEIMQQITAIKSSVEKVGWLIIRDHAADCLMAEPMTKDEVNKTIQRIAQFLK
ncbi:MULTISPECIES: metal-sensitive transcriptional regulator [Anoxynatronum]|uniref:DNA-binding transcriptional regulator, FrmR family n=2 Tax=Anoxynatronum TaxID=210622 RepID=A0AA45WWS7_9CLOT|nr:metal-sensitive transcriptional regulator [Anoxynatronum buryatiense]SMP61283.1 DNA-binding transcriptional regulator, FrmR family [Anoxynatronum buryatiense]